MDDNVKVKAKFKKTSRRFELSSSSTWNDLVSQLRCFFDIQDGRHFDVKYCDDENELVSISSQVELSEAIRLTRHTSRLLYLYIEDPMSRQTMDQTLDQIHADLEGQSEDKGSSCYSDLASAMAVELSALNKRLEKSRTQQSTKKEEVEKQKENNVKQPKKNKKKKSDGDSCYSELASAIAPQLSSLNERMAKKEKDTPNPAKDTQQGEKKDSKQDGHKHGSCYTDLASAIAPELSSLNERMAKKEKDTSKPAKKLPQGEKKDSKQDENKHGSCYTDLASAIAPELSSLNERMAKKERDTSKPAKKLPQGEKKDSKQDGNKHGSCYTDLASAIAPELSSLNERMAKKEKDTPKPAKDIQQGEKKDSKQDGHKHGSCYTDLASAIAPELSSLNERMTKKEKEVNKTDGKHQAAPAPTEVTQVIEPPKSCYINLEEMMARPTDGSVTLSSVNSVEQQGSEPQSSEIGASRGWFGHFEEQQASASKKTKKQGCYNERAASIASELKNLNVNEPDKAPEESMDCKATASDDSTVKEPSFLPPPTNMNPESKRQLDGQCEKKPKRSKKHNKRNKCYAQLAEDISPMFQAMNKRLEEKQKQEASKKVDMPAEPDMASLSSLPESSEPFVFVTNDHELFSSSSSIEMVESQTSPEPSLDDDFDSAGTIPPAEQRDTSSSNLISFDESIPKSPAETDEDSREIPQSSVKSHEDINEIPQSPAAEAREDLDNLPPSPAERLEDMQEMPAPPSKSHEDMKQIVKEILKESMETIVSVAVQRIQTPNPPATPCNTPQENASSLGLVVHKGITCDNCGVEIQGIRYKCCNCKDFDLCETCEEMPVIHKIEHVFVKLKYPAPGIGRRHGEMVPIFKKSVYKRRCERKQKEKELRRAAKEAERERKRAVREKKHALKAQEKELKKKAKKVHKTKDKEETGKIETSNVCERLRAGFVSDASYPDGTVVFPGQKFVKEWLVRNDGDIAWNQWITLECVEGSIMGFPIPVPFLKPDTTEVVSVEFVAPEIPGTYTSQWQLFYGLHKFGPQLWCEIKVPDRKEEERIIHCHTYSLVDTSCKIESSSQAEVKIVHETKLQSEIEDDSSSSEYLSPEESPEGDSVSLSSSPEEKKQGSLASNVSAFRQRQDLEWDAGCVYNVQEVKMSSHDVEIPRGTRNIDNWSLVDSDDSDGEESDSSLDEFTVLVPTCFDLDAPLSADPVPVRVIDFKSHKRSNSISSPFLNSLAAVDPAYDEYGPSSLPNIGGLNMDEGNPLDGNTTDEPANVSTDCEPVSDSPQSDNTPSGSLHPSLTEEPATACTPVSRQPSISQRDSIPLVTQPTTVLATHCKPDENCDSNNLVSEVLNTAIDAVAMAGRAAFATVDNLINGVPQTSAVYKPQNEDVTLVSRGTDMDAPPPPDLNWPVNRTPSTSSMDRLIEMGFCDRRLNQRLLHKHKDDINSTIEELLSHGENEWSSQRH